MKLFLLLWITNSFSFVAGWGIRSLILHSRKRQRPFRG